jgi:hypothetical protein
MTITNLADLCDFLAADEPRLLNKRLYKATDCGASISLYLPDGAAIHNGSALWEKLPVETPIRGFTIQTIVEGSDATVDSDEFVLPVESETVDAWIKQMEEQAAAEWENANNPMCECGHRSEGHRWAEDTGVGIAGAIKGYECQDKDCTCREFKEDEWYGVE